ncbi:MAG: L-seryl-tRNA(Sec) selenium transferase [Planctomycetota bacterium]|nr:L-seryl-tRNA(Sec) selenium transferase [Planctomycetota bacterium]
MSQPDTGELLRRLPQVDRLLQRQDVMELAALHSRALVLAECRSLFDSLRARALSGELAASELEEDNIVTALSERLERREQPFYRRVVNATGIVLHTGLGRAPIPPDVANTLVETLRHPVRVEVDLESGERGGRDEGCAELLRELTGAEDATVVNNNAGATLLLLSALACEKEVLVSHGELVEIGGSFRIPEIMEQGGARLCAVGTTNRTRTADYDSACGPESAMILKVHTSNYRVVGFTEETEIEELCQVGKKHDIPVVHDMGSGCMVDLAAHGKSGESWVRESVQAGCGLVCFSGDKLLGGPQAGIIVGTSDLVQRCRKHPLYRALRPGRMTYIALEQTLRIYLRGEDEAIARIPALQRVLASTEELEGRLSQLIDSLRAIPGVSAEPISHDGYAGSGSLPARPIESRAARVDVSGVSATELARLLRTGDPAVLPTVHDESVHLDVRTISEDEVELIAARVAEITNRA